MGGGRNAIRNVAVIKYGEACQIKIGRQKPRLLRRENSSNPSSRNIWNFSNAFSILFTTTITTKKKSENLYSKFSLYLFSQNYYLKKVNRKIEIFLYIYNITIQFKFPYTPFIQTSSYFHKVIIWKKWTEKLKFSYTYTISQYNLNFLILHLSKLPPIFTKLLFEKTEKLKFSSIYTHIYIVIIQFKFPYTPFIQTSVTRNERSEMIHSHHV